MKKRISDLFDNYYDESVEIECDTDVSAERIVELTKNKITEDNTLNNKTKKKWLSVIIVAALVAVISCSAFAAIYFLKPNDVANKLGMYTLAETFSKDDTLFDVPSQVSGNYKFDLLGITSGKNLDGVDNEEIESDKSYIVGAITNTDGTEMKEYPDIMISPLFKGYKPWQMNIFTIGNASRTMIIYEGVVYFLLECSNIEIFADNTIYIAAYEGFLPNDRFFDFSEDGTISFSENYVGTKALFEIKLDSAKANPEAVKAIIDEHGWTE